MKQIKLLSRSYETLSVEDEIFYECVNISSLLIYIRIEATKVAVPIVITVISVLYNLEAFPRAPQGWLLCRNKFIKLHCITIRSKDSGVPWRNMVPFVADSAKSMRTLHRSSRLLCHSKLTEARRGNAGKRAMMAKNLPVRA